MEMLFDIVLVLPQSWTIRRLSPKNTIGMLDIILFQRDLKIQLREKILEDIHLPAEEKKIKKCFSSQSEIQAQWGFPSGPRSKLKPGRKAAFLTGSSAVSDQYFETVYKWVYTQ